EQRANVLKAITRAANGIAEAAGGPADRAPLIEMSRAGGPATVNDRALSLRGGAALEERLGKENGVRTKSLMASEDFSLFGLSDPKPPTVMFWLGAVDPAKFKEAQEKGTRLPSLHSSVFYPLPEPAIRTGVKAMTAAVEELLRK